MRVPDEAYRERFASTDFQPIFILGDHRSGTTLLYDLLGRTGAFNILTVYHILRYPELVRNHVEGRTDEAKGALMRQFADLGIVDRKIDGVKVTPETPEEYGWLLKGMPTINRLTLGRFMEVCRKVQFVSQADRPLLLKNPWDYDRRFLRVAGLFPEAKFVFIHRNPAEVINSRLKVARITFSEPNPYGMMISRRYQVMFKRRIGLYIVRFLYSDTWDLGARMTSRHVAAAASYYLDHVSELPPSRYIEIRYEDLCEQPNERVKEIMDFLGLQDRTGEDFSALIAKRPIHLLPDVERQLPRIAPRLRRYCERFGYSLPG